jgi:hypothetical protein
MVLVKMNVINEVRDLLDKMDKCVTRGISNPEYRAYHIGANNALAALYSLLTDENKKIAVIHDDDTEIQQEIGSVRLKVKVYKCKNVKNKT